MIGEEQHFDPAGAGGFELRIGLEAGDAVADEVIDFRLVRLEIGEIFLERAERVTMGGGEAGERQEIVLALAILVEPFLEGGAECLPDFEIGFGLVFGLTGEFGDDFAGDCLADLGELDVVLQHFAGDVERQVLAVDNAADEAQIIRHERGVVGDENAADIEFHAVLEAGIVEIERADRGHEQHDGVGLPPLGLVMQREGGLVIGVAERAVGLGVILGRELGFRALPERAGLVDLAGGVGIDLQHDRELDVIGIAADNALDLVGFEIFEGVGLEMQHDLGAADTARGAGLVGGFNGKSLAAR